MRFENIMAANDEHWSHTFHRSASRAPTNIWPVGGGIKSAHFTDANLQLLWQNARRQHVRPDLLSCCQHLCRQWGGRGTAASLDRRFHLSSFCVLCCAASHSPKRTRVHAASIHLRRIYPCIQSCRRTACAPLHTCSGAKINPLRPKTNAGFLTDNLQSLTAKTRNTTVKIKNSIWLSK